MNSVKLTAEVLNSIRKRGVNATLDSGFFAPIAKKTQISRTGGNFRTLGREVSTRRGVSPLSARGEAALASKLGKSYPGLNLSFGDEFRAEIRGQDITLGRPLMNILGRKEREAIMLHEAGHGSSSYARLNFDYENNAYQMNHAIEYSADAFAAQSQGTPRHMASALQKMQKAYPENGLGGYTHPSISKRTDALNSGLDERDIYKRAKLSVFENRASGHRERKALINDRLSQKPYASDYGIYLESLSSVSPESRDIGSDALARATIGDKRQRVKELKELGSPPRVIAHKLKIESPDLEESGISRLSKDNSPFDFAKRGSETFSLASVSAVKSGIREVDEPYSRVISDVIGPQAGGFRRSARLNSRKDALTANAVLSNNSKTLQGISLKNMLAPNF